MSETGEMPPEYVEEGESKIVRAARGAVGTVLEADERFKKAREEMRVGGGFFRIYEAWDKARKGVVDKMTTADRESLNTKLYELKTKLGAGASQALELTLSVASKAMVLTGTGIIAASPFVGFIGLGSIPAGLGLIAGGAALGGLRGHWERVSIGTAKRHEFWSSTGYKIKEGRMLKGKAVKALGETVDEKVHSILTGFAYPEGKPVKPPMAKI